VSREAVNATKNKKTALMAVFKNQYKIKKKA
jgi:hypothetical protein